MNDRERISEKDNPLEIDFLSFNIFIYIGLLNNNTINKIKKINVNIKSILYIYFNSFHDASVKS